MKVEGKYMRESYCIYKGGWWVVSKSLCLHVGNEAIEKEALDWNPQGKRRRGRPKQTWRRSVHNEALEEGKSWGEVKKLARNRIRWRRFVDALCP